MNDLRIIRSRAPMRVSFGGGGSEIDPYRTLFGGKVMNSTIAIYAHVLLIETNDRLIEIRSSDNNEYFSTPIDEYVSKQFEEVPKSCLLAVAALQYFSRELNCPLANGIKINTFSDAPVGSGLGASSTMTVAIVHLLHEYFKIPYDTYDLALTAHKIEREYLNLAGGIQDHFCAAFGGFNYMEFGPNDHLLINPLRIKRETLFELESSLVLIYTGTSRDSAKIIQNQISEMKSSTKFTNETLLKIAQNATQLKSSILKWDLSEFATLLSKGWDLKKFMSVNISNSEIDDLVTKCVNSEALGVKLCGAGGGGYLLVAIPPENRANLIKQIKKGPEDFIQITFVDHGSEVWNSKRN
jgi:D-glycero-alpha-D-manno-heptose-7-phosphate kinase